MKKCKECALKDCKPFYECSECMNGDSHFRAIPGKPPRTHFDAITESPKKLATFLANFENPDRTEDEILDWLKQPAEEE